MGSSRQQDGEQALAREQAARAAELAAAAATAAGRAASAGAKALAEAVGEAAQRSEALQAAAATAVEAAESATERARELVERLPAPLVVEGVLEDAGARLGTVVERSGDAWDVLRGRPKRQRRWPWATGAAVVGAAAGVGAALLVRALRPEDAPGAQDPSEVRAVVDTATPTVAAKAAPVPAEHVDEDGEAVQP